MAANPYKPRQTMLRAPTRAPVGPSGLGPMPGGGPSNPRSLSPGAVVLDRYVIQKVIGRGGMAAVYLARNQETERLVALKILDPEISADPSYVERFRREARAAGRIRSDHVVAIYDLGTDSSGTLVLVMEYLEGQTVQQALRNGRMPIPRVLTLARQLCEGLAAAHENGVVHRDLKPANLFIERTTGGGEKLKVLDFGISKLADASSQELTRAGQTLGTLAYMAPEQIRGTVKGNDPRIDLYSAGVSIFLMLTAKRPIDAEDTVQLLQAVLEKPPLTLQQACGVDFPPALEAFIEKSLHKDATKRFQTALEMRDALARAGGVGDDLLLEDDEPAEIGAATMMAPPPSMGSFPEVSRPSDPRSATPPSGVVVAAGAAHAGPPGPVMLPSFDDDEEEGKTVVRAPMTSHGESSGEGPVLPAAGRRIDASLTPSAAQGPQSSAMRAPTMPPRGPMGPVPTAPGPGGAQAQPRSPTLMGMAPVQAPPPSAGGGPEAAGPDDDEGVNRTMAMDVFGDAARGGPMPGGLMPGGPMPGGPMAPQGASPFGPPASHAFPGADNPMAPPAAVTAAPTSAARPKRSPMTLLLGGASAVALALVAVAGYVAFAGPGRTPAPTAAVAATTEPATAPPPESAPAAAAPAAAAPAEPAPTAQPLAPTPEPQAAAAPEAPTTAPEAPAAAAPAAAPEAPAPSAPAVAAAAPTPPPAAAPAAPAAAPEPAPAAAHRAGREHHARAPRAEAPAVRTVAAPSAPAAPRASGGRRGGRRGAAIIGDVPF